jgi:hypothetical protein
LTDSSVEKTGKQLTKCETLLISTVADRKFVFSVPVHIGLYTTIFAKGLSESMTNSSVRPSILCLQVYTKI